MRVLEALTILEEATLDCKIRAIDTPEVQAALGVLQPYCRPKWRITGFRDHLQAHDKGPDREGQQQVLRVYFAGIYDNVRQLLSTEIKPAQRSVRENKKWGSETGTGAVEN